MMNVLALLACLALASCALGVLGLARVTKPRRSLQAIERTCLLDPLSLPTQQQQQRHDTETAAATFLRARISVLLAPLARVEQGGGADPRAAAAAEAPDAIGILRFLASQPLVLVILRLSGLSLLMANQHEHAAPAVVTVDDHNHSNTYSATAELSHTTKRVDTRVAEPTATTASDRSDSDSEGYDSDDSATSDDDDDDTINNNTSSSKSMFERSATDAQHALFDGLQFYNVLSQVGSATVSAVVQQAMRNTAASVAQARAQASISAIEQRYPDILCLAQPAYAQTSTRTDLATVLLAVTAATAAMQQQQQQRTASQAMPCSSMERRLSTKRPDSLALAQEDDSMGSARRTPLTSPASSSASQLEASFLQAA